MRAVAPAVAALGAAVLLSGCQVPPDLTGYYTHPDAGLIDLDDEGHGSYTRFAGDIRAVRGDHRPATTDDVRSKAPEETPPPPVGPADGRSPGPGTSEPPWDTVGLEFRVHDDVVTLLPVGGDPVDLRMVEGDLVLMQPGGLELVFRR